MVGLVQGLSKLSGRVPAKILYPTLAGFAVAYVAKYIGTLVTTSYLLLALCIPVHYSRNRVGTLE